MSKTACLQIPVGDNYAQWIQWHKALKGCVGKNNANQLWLMNYEKVQPGDNYELRNYMSSQGVDLDRDVLERLTDFGGGVYNWFGGALDFTSGLTVAILVIIVGGAGLMIFNVAKTTDADKAMRAGIAIGSRGMSEAGPMLGGGQPKMID